MYYEFSIGINGMLEANVVSDECNVHFGEPESVDGEKVVPITGDTYPIKEDIKSLNYGETGRKWTGDFWCVRVGSADKAIKVVCEVEAFVSVAPEVVYECDSLSDFRGKIEIDDDEDETFEFIVGPSEGDERVSRSWAEDAAERGNFDDLEDFAERFNLEIADDEVLFDDFDSPDEVGDVVGSRQAAE